MATTSDGMFTGNTGSTVTQPGDCASSAQNWSQQPNNYTQYHSDHDEDDGYRGQ